MEDWLSRYCGAFVDYLQYVNNVAMHSYVWHDTVQLFSRICKFVKGSVVSTEYRFSIHCYNFIEATVNRAITVWVDCEGNLMFLENGEVIPIENYSPIELMAIVAVLKGFFNIEPNIWIPDTAEMFVKGVDNMDNILRFKERHFVMPMVTIQGNLIEIVNWHKFYMR